MDKSYIHYQFEKVGTYSDAVLRIDQFVFIIIVISSNDGYFDK